MAFSVQLTKRPKRLKDGRVVHYWTLRWYATNGKLHSESIGRVGEITKTKAESLRRQKEAGITAGLLQRNKPETITLGRFLDLDYEAIKPDVKPNTLEGHRHAALHAKGALGEHTRLQQIGPHHIARIKNYLLTEKKSAPATVAKTLRTLKAAFYRAQKLGLLQHNPFAGVKMPRTQSRPKRVFSPEETRAMRESAPSLWWRVFILLAETSGLRKGELLNLLWQDIDFKQKTVRVAAKRAATFNADGHGELPILEWSAKSYHERTIPLPNATLAMLQELRKEMAGSPYVFLSLDRLATIRQAMEAGEFGANYELANNINRWFDKVQEAAKASLAAARSVEPDKIEWPRGTIHDLRRTYGTRIARIVPIHVLKEYMGHAKIQTTQEYYLAAEAVDAQATRGALDAMVSGRTSTNHNSQRSD